LLLNSQLIFIIRRSITNRIIELMNLRFTKSILFLFNILIISLLDAQPVLVSSRFIFISDCQQLIFKEKFYLHSYKNEIARDSLFSDILRQNTSTLFMLGDLVSFGSINKKWKPIDLFIQNYRKTNGKIYAIPGNHEYMLSPAIGFNAFSKRFPDQTSLGYCVIIDSIGFLMLNSNFHNLLKDSIAKQQQWFVAEMKDLEQNSAIKSIIVCTHHSPYSNSKIVGSSIEVQHNFVSLFEKSTKAKLFLSGHSHNLELFNINHKSFLVLGGGGGLKQPLYEGNQQKYDDLIGQNLKPLYFYIILERKGNQLIVKIRGVKKDFGKFIEYEALRIQI
jgi:predicted MPP superfamily phosphohydrolase